MKTKSTRANFKRSCIYADKTLGLDLWPDELKVAAKYKVYAPTAALFPVFSALMTGCKSTAQIKGHMDGMNKRLGKVSSRCISTIAGLLGEKRTSDYLNEYLLSLFYTCNSLRKLRLKEFSGKIVAFIDGIDLGEVRHGGGKCDLCLERRHRNGEVRHFHKLVVLSIMSKHGPIPIYFRFVRQTELTVKHGDTSEERFKQECELTCARKILVEIAGKFRGKLPFDILGGDALFANAPFMELVEALGSAGIFVFNQENRKLYKQAKADFSGESLGFNIRKESWKNSYCKGRKFESNWGQYVDVNRKNEGKNVRIFETTRTEKNGETKQSMAITTDKKTITAPLVEVVRAGKWHDLENGVFNELATNWGTLKHIFIHDAIAMQSMIAMQIICLVVSIFYRFSNLTRGFLRFTETLCVFFKQMYSSYEALRKKALCDLVCNSPP